MDKSNIFFKPEKTNVRRAKIGDKVFCKYIAATDIHKTIGKMAWQIRDDYKKDIPLLLVVMNGALVFAADLMRALRIPLEMSVVKYTSYQGTQSTEKVSELLGINQTIENRRIIIVEDIVDSGLTVAAIWKILETKNVKDIRVAALTFKPNAYRQNLPIDYIGMNIENQFIVGYGMDYNGLGRNLKDIYQLQE
jgi:hypoxanthine phosphoribosyltransferase